MDVIVIAEGGRDRGTSAGVPPLEAIPDDALGAAHALVRRILEASPSPVRFLAPLTVRGRVPRGSDLCDAKALRKLLVFAGRRPDLVVVLVDSDGERARARTLEEIVARRDQPAIPVVVGVPVQELEAWLVADIKAVNDALGAAHDERPAPESMSRGHAKAWLDGAIAERGDDFSVQRRARRAIAERCSLERVGSRCPSFEAFRRALEGARG